MIETYESIKCFNLIKIFNNRRGEKMKKPVYIRCPRCELNYIQKKDKYCSVCKAEMEAKKDDLDDLDLELCPICKTNYIQADEIMCSTCLKEHRSEDGDLTGDWEDYLVSDDNEDSIYDELGEMASVNELTKSGMLDDDDMDSVAFAEDDDLGFGEEDFGEEGEEIDEVDDFEDDFEDEDDFDYDEDEDFDDDFDDDDDEEDEDYDDDDE